MARYDSLRKLERNKLLRDYRDNHPELSLKEIGKVFRISQPRVWFILFGGNKKVKGGKEWLRKEE